MRKQDAVQKFIRKHVIGRIECYVCGASEFPQGVVAMRGAERDGQEPFACMKCVDELFFCWQELDRER